MKNMNMILVLVGLALLGAQSNMFALKVVNKSNAGYKIRISGMAGDLMMPKVIAAGASDAINLDAPMTNPQIYLAAPGRREQLAKIETSRQDPGSVVYQHAVIMLRDSDTIVIKDGNRVQIIHGLRK